VQIAGAGLGDDPAGTVSRASPPVKGSQRRSAPLTGSSSSCARAYEVGGPRSGSPTSYVAESSHVDATVARCCY